MAQSADLILCEKCFAMMPKGSEFCAECGAPLEDAPGIGGSDQEVYPELAKANLHRMRKEYKPAKDICLGILRRFPNNASANTLLGDICVEQDDLEQAAEWYELALDIVPDSAADKAKLDDVRAKLAEKEKAVTVESLGITHTNKPPYVTIAAIIVAVAIIGVAVGMAVSGGNQKQAVGDKPILIGDKPQNSSTQPVQSDGPQTLIKDPDLAAKIAGELKLEDGRLVYAEVGEKDKSVTLTYLLKEEEEWITRAKLVQTVFIHAPEAPTVTLILTREFKNEDRHVVDRVKFTESQSPEWLQSTGGTEVALVELFFGKKIEPPVVTPDPAPTTDPNATGTSGTQTTPPIGEGTEQPEQNQNAEPPPQGNGNAGGEMGGA